VVREEPEISERADTHEITRYQTEAAAEFRSREGVWSVRKRWTAWIAPQL